MPVPAIADFWRLAAASQLLGPEQLALLQRDFGGLRGAERQSNTRTLCEWLIDRQALSRFQCDVLLLRQAGPFQYGDYRLLDRISHGRFSRLFRAVHLPTGHNVMLKFLSGPATQMADKMAAVRTDARAWAAIEEPHLSACFELLEIGAYKFVVLDDLRGESAAERLRTSGRLAPADACAMARDAAQGLARLHALGRVHGDVRPENVWRRSDGSICLLGFPVARNPLGPPAGLDEWTADYAAPELADAPSGPTPLVDIYALGCTLYELLTGKAPFAGTPQRQTIPQKMVRHATEAIVPIDGLGDMPAGLNRVISFMMAKNSAVRFQQAAAVAEALRAFAPEVPVVLPAVSPTAAALRDFCRKRPPITAPIGDQGGARDRPNAAAAGFGQSIVAEGFAQSVAAGGNHLSAAGIGSLPGPSASLPTSCVDRIGPARAAAVADGPGAPTPFGFGGPALDELFRLEPGAGMGSGPAIPGGLLAGASPTRKSRMATSRGSMLLVGAIMVSLALLIGGLMAVEAHFAPATPTPLASAEASQGDRPADSPPEVENSAGGKESPRTVADDGKSLWASPTRGDPPQIKYVAPGVQILVVIRPQALLGSPRGRQAMEAMGPAGQSLLAWIEAQTGVKPEAVDRLDIALYEAYGSRPLTSLVAYMKNRPAPGELVARWGSPTPRDQGGHAFYQKDDRCYYLPPGAPRAIVVAPRSQLDDILATGDSPATLDPNLQSLVESADAQRHVTAFFLPIYLLGARDTLYPGTLRPVRDAIERFLGPSDALLCGAISFEFGDPFFAELRLYPARNKKPVVAARDFHQRIDEWSQLVQGHLITLAVSPYSRDQLGLLPFMLESLARYTRHGVEGRDGIVRCYLPGQAGPNLVSATDLLLLETGGTVASSGTTGGTPPASPKTVWDRLKQPVTIRFDRDSLENALKLLSTEMGVKIEIVGNDLKLDGITKNQPLGLDLSNRPAEEVLNRIMLLANPDRTVKKLSDRVQKLVYVVKPKYQGGEDAILVTTRAKAAEHGELPAVFTRSP